MSSLWVAIYSTLKRRLRRMRDFEKDQERRLLEAYTRGRHKRRQRR